MKASILVTLAVMLLAPGAGVARTRPNPDARLVLDPAAARGGARIHAGPSHASSAALVPLPAGAVQLDSTYYDLQDMGSLGARIVRTSGGDIHVTWQDDLCELDANGCPPNLGLPNPHPQRGMVYARRVGGVWTRVGKVVDPGIRGCCVTETFGGFGTIDLTSDGRAVVAAHMNEDGCDLRGDMYVLDSVGGSTYQCYLTPIDDPSLLFPQVSANPNGSFSLLGEVELFGDYSQVDDFRVAYLAAEGPAFVCPLGWQFGAWNSVVASNFFPGDGASGFPALAHGSDGRVGIAVTDFGRNVFLMESSNGTFQAGTVTVTNLTNYSNATITNPGPASTEYRPYINCHLAYHGTTPHVVWSEIQARNDGGIFYVDYRSRIRHWSPGSGVTTVKQVQAGEADSFDDLEETGSGPIAGFNTVSVDWPQVGFNDAGTQVVVAWLRFHDDEIDPSADAGAPGIITGVGFGDIVASVFDGSNWSAAQNLTSTPDADERFFSIPVRNAAGKVHVLFQTSATDQAGVSVIGDRGLTPGNLVRRIAYLEAALDGSVTAVAGVAPALGIVRVYPNPAAGRTHFLFSSPGETGAAARVDVFDVTGKRIARVAAHGDRAVWDGRDAAGNHAPSGIYFARLHGVESAKAMKFVLLR